MNSERQILTGWPSALEICYQTLIIIHFKHAISISQTPRLQQSHFNQAQSIIHAYLLHNTCGNHFSFVLRNWRGPAVQI